MRINAARELLTLVDAWNRGQTVWDVRTSTGDIWEDEHRAVRLLKEVEGFLLTREDSEEFSDIINELREFVFASNASWGRNAAQLEKHDRMQLRLVGELMDSAPTTMVIDEVEVDALRDTVQECLDVLNAETLVDEERANYARYLLRRCLDILEGESVDLFALRDLSFQATGAVTAVSLDLSDEARKKIGQAFIRLVTPWMSNMTSGAVGGAIATASTAGLLPPGS